MEYEEPRKPAQPESGAGSNPFDTETDEPERGSGAYSFVYHEVARITMVRKSMPARAPSPESAPSSDETTPSGGDATRTKK